MTKHADRDRSEPYWPPAATREPRVRFPLDDGDTGASLLPVAPAGTLLRCPVCPAALADTRGGRLDHCDDGSDHYVPAQPADERPAVIDAAHLQRQRDFSHATFGPGTRTAGVTDHIRRELLEIEAEPHDLNEWVDVAILALDGAWRAGWQPQQIIDAIIAKQTRNEARTWPDWRTAAPDRAIEHVRDEPEPCPHTCSCTSDDECPHDCPCDGA